MKIFTAQQIYDADKFTIAKQQIESDALMERAAVQIFNWMHMRMQGAPVKIHLFCGIGNNGGDGVALARHLQEHGYNLDVFIVNYSEKRSKDFLTNLDRLKARKVWPHVLSDCKELPVIGKDDIIVDAIFGIGLNRSPDAWVMELMQHLNNSGAFILSVDIPSGLFMDALPPDPNGVIRADYALSFQAPKLVFFLPETGIYVNQWEVLDIGLDMEFLMQQETSFELIGKQEVLPLYVPREKYAHKGTFGHAYIVGGSYGKIGAVLLAAKACLYSGSGLVTAYMPKCGYIPMQSSFPEAMVRTDTNETTITKIKFDASAAVIGMGIGMGTAAKTVTAFSNFLDENKTPLVLDADALNILAKNKNMLAKLPPQTILTPHPKELERLVGKWKNDFDKLQKVKKFSKKFDCIVVIKGANSITIYHDQGFINTTGNPGMATAGSGDVLTGIITGLVAQGYPPIPAAIFSVYLHGRAGDIAVEQTGYQALTATHVLEAIGKSFIDLFKVPEPPKGTEEQEQPQEA